MPSTASSCATSAFSRSDGRRDLLLSSRVLCALLALSLARGALAWGPEAHRMVGDIASRHLDDIPLCETPDYSRYCRNGQCASAQIDRQLRVLGDSSARLVQRNRALKWVVHLVGDIHQPLHAANRRDRGGNTVQVSFFGQRDNPPYGSLNLHAVWDVHMVRRLVAGRGGERAFVSASLSERDKAAWEKGSISGWVGDAGRWVRYRLRHSVYDWRRSPLSGRRADRPGRPRYPCHRCYVLNAKSPFRAAKSCFARFSGSSRSGSWWGRSKAASCAPTRRYAECSATARVISCKKPCGTSPIPTIWSPTRSSGRSSCREGPTRASTRSVMCARTARPSGSRSWGRWCATNRARRNASSCWFTTSPSSREPRTSSRRANPGSAAWWS